MRLKKLARPAGTALLVVVLLDIVATAAAAAVGRDAEEMRLAHMTNARLAELVLALIILAGSIWLYRRRDPSAGGGYGNQGAVLLLVVGAIMLDPRHRPARLSPERAELERMHGQ